MGAANPNFLWLLAFNAFLAYFTNLTNFLVGCPVTCSDSQPATYLCRESSTTKARTAAQMSCTGAGHSC